MNEVELICQMAARIAEGICQSDYGINLEYKDSYLSPEEVAERAFEIAKTIYKNAKRV